MDMGESVVSDFVTAPHQIGKIGFVEVGSVAVSSTAQRSGHIECASRTIFLEHDRSVMSRAGGEIVKRETGDWCREAGFHPFDRDMGRHAVVNEISDALDSSPTLNGSQDRTPAAAPR
jgi:hypothetical protein